MKGTEMSKRERPELPNAELQLVDPRRLCQQDADRWEALGEVRHGWNFLSIYAKPDDFTPEDWEVIQRGAKALRWLTHDLALYGRYLPPGMLREEETDEPAESR